MCFMSNSARVIENFRFVVHKEHKRVQNGKNAKFAFNLRVKQ